MNHDEYEWQAQENALNSERSSEPPRSDDPLMARYRLVARALREPSPIGLPEDFAVQMARRVAAPIDLDARFEQRLVTLLVGLFGVSGVIVAAIYGSDWLRASSMFVPELGATSLKWLLVVLACVGMSWTMGLLRFGQSGRER